MKPTHKNPFFAGKAISDAGGFFGRQELVEDIVNTLTNTQQSIVLLHGQRRIGKSSLLYRLERDEELRQKNLPIIFDMQNYQGLSRPRILHILANDIRQALGAEIPLPTEEVLATNAFIFQKTFLPQVYEQLADSRLLILIDEFDAISKSDKNSPENDFLIYLRSLLAEDQTHLAFIFVISQRLDHLSDNYLRLIKAASARPVGRFQQEEAVKLLTELGSQGDMSFTDEALVEIWRLTSGHPYLTQLFGLETFERIRTSDHRQVNLEVVTASIGRIVETAEAVLTWFWKDLERVERLILTAIAELTSSSEQGVSDAEISEALQKYMLRTTPTARREAYKFLLDGDFMIDTGQRHYKFAVEIIRRWVAQRHPLKEAQSSRKAQYHYDEGYDNLSNGKQAEAVEQFQLALADNPDYAEAHAGLAAALRATGKIEEAIKAYEKAFDLAPEVARANLIEVRMKYAQELRKTGKQMDLLAQTERVLEINPDHPQARETVSNIWLEKIAASLVEDDFSEAKDLVSHLIEPVSLVQDAPVAQRIRSMWLTHSDHLAQDDANPVQALTNAQKVLQSLTEFKLEDDSIKKSFNRFTLNKAQVFLADNQIKQALGTLETELKKPLPANEIKALLLDYSQQQIERQAWSEADQVRQKLVELVNDKESREAQNELYHQWGDALRARKAFDQAVEVYKCGTAKVFTPKIAETYLEQGENYLAQEELSQVKSSYQLALAARRSKAIQQDARETLVKTLTRYRSERYWLKAEHTLQILQELELAGKDEVDGWQTDLHFEQAEDDLSRKNDLDAAFGRLDAHEANHPKRIKMLFKDYLQLAARQGHWPDGHEALERLETLLSSDNEIACWRANWLYLWAKACFPKETLKKDPIQAWDLCQKILSFAPEGTPLLDLLSGDDGVPEKRDDKLRQHTCHLAADIALEQAQANLDQAELDPAREQFEAALKLPIPPDGLKRKIHDILLAYSQSQSLKEENKKARRALKTIRDLDLDDQGDQGENIEVLIRNIPITEARSWLKADQPDKAFQSLGADSAELSDEEREAIKAMVYQFSRLYAGRNRWNKARQALVGLQEWLGPHGNNIASLRDMLNREHLNFIKGQSAPVSVPPHELERLSKELEAAKTGYEEARELGLESASEWADDFISVGLRLGQSYLSNGNLKDAVEKAFEEIFQVGTPVPVHRDQIAQNLHNYSDRVLKDKQWAEAEQALGQLKTFNLAAPDGQTRPDPRVDGALQRVLLTQAQDHLDRDLLKEVLETPVATPETSAPRDLDHDLLKEVFETLKQLPPPKPTGKVRKIILHYSKQCRQQNAWENAAEALERLDAFLQSDNPDARDQQTLGEWVNCLEQWAGYLEKAGDLEQAAAKYEKALKHTRDAARSRNIELAGHFIQMNLQLTQQCLEKDPHGPEPPPTLDKALSYCAAILAVIECTPTQKEAVNTTLYTHARDLALAGQWPRASHLLDQLDQLYAPATPDAYKTTFAGWRRDLVLDEVKKHLGRPQQPDPDQAFMLLEELKAWLEMYKAADVSWRGSQDQVKETVNDSCQGWGTQNQWAWAADTLGRLSRLIPEDKEVVGWRVDTLHRWGQHLQQENSLAEAIEHYSLALSLAPKQEIVSLDALAESLLQTQLAQAKQHLEDQAVPEAIQVYEAILKNPPAPDNRADQIRQAVMGHCDALISQNPPQWQQAHHLRSQLLNLNLDNDPVQQWHQELTLRHLNVLLRQHKIDQAFDSLNNLVGVWPLPDIEQVIKQYVDDHAQASTWEDALEALTHFAGCRGDDETVQAWVKEELINLGKTLQEQELLGPAREAYKQARQFE